MQNASASTAPAGNDQAFKTNVSVFKSPFARLIAGKWPRRKGGSPGGTLWCLVLGLCSITISAQAQENKDDLGDAASNATNPLAFVTKLQLQPGFYWLGNEGHQISVVSRIIKPSPTLLLPFIKSKDVSKVYTITRLEMPVVSQTQPYAYQSDATGLGDIILLDALAFRKSFGVLGVGPGLVLPTASAVQLGGGKVCLGVTGVLLNTKTKGMQWGALLQQFFSVAGQSNRPSRNFLLLQPIFNKILTKGRFLSFGPTMNLDWKNDHYTVPLSLSYGKAFARNLSMSIGPEYIVSGPTKGDFNIKVNLNTMFAQ